MATRGIQHSGTDSREQHIGQAPSLDIPVDNSPIIRTDQQIETVSASVGTDYIDELRFNEELVEVLVHETTDKNEQMLVDVYVEGVPQRFIRGTPQRVKRKFLAALAYAKQTSLTTAVENNGNEVVNRINKHTALRYPFSVVRDENPRGAGWLRGILASA